MGILWIVAVAALAGCFAAGYLIGVDLTRQEFADEQRRAEREKNRPGDPGR